MKVKELIALLEKVNPEADVIVDVDAGSIYPVDTLQTVESNDPAELATCVEFGLVCRDW
jgi:hypothetical protein